MEKTQYYCDKCGEEDERCRTWRLGTTSGSYEVLFILCRKCKTKVFDDFVSGLKSYSDLKRDSVEIVRSGRVL